MRLNISKCRVIKFSRRTVVIKHDYSLDSELVTRSEAVNDLGVLMDSRMTFKSHVNQVVSRAKSTLGFIKRLATGFQCPYVTRSLYC